MNAAREQTADPDEHAERLRQQAMVAEFGIFALRERAVDRVIQEACTVAASGLRCRLAKMLAYRPPSNDFLVRAGVGWQPGVVGHATLGAGLDSPAGYALHTGAPVLSHNLGAEDRFRVPKLLADHGVHSAVNVIVGAGLAEPFGVLEADSSNRHGFEEADTAFMQSLANVLAAVLERDGNEAALRRSEQLAQRVLESSPDCVKVLDGTGVVVAVNGNGLALMENCTEGSALGRHWEEIWPEAARADVRQAVAAARAGGLGQFEAMFPTLMGEPRWWDVRVAPIDDSFAGSGQLVAISRDVTERRAAVAAQEELLRQKDLLMQEVHHRVKNSLQLVRTLLQLQGRTATPEAREQLDEAAQRIMTIGAVHQRLYEGGSVEETDAATYLRALLSDMRGLLESKAEGRDILLDVDSIRLSADHITPVGLATTELVTNALKYGAGSVRVLVRRVPAGVEVQVEDDGAGFPPGFNPARGRGLGMRLLTAMAKGDSTRAIRIDPDVPSRIIVTLTLGSG